MTVDKVGGIVILVDALSYPDDMVGGIVVMVDALSIAVYPSYTPMKIAPEASGATTLKSKKVPWAHLSRSLYPPGWLGKSSQIDSIDIARGKLSGRYVRSGGSPLGEFSHIARTVQSPGTSSLSIEVKERIYESLYNWAGDIDFDVRLQLCGRVDDPINWAMIKRLCSSIITYEGTKGETIITADDDGETIINATASSHNHQLVIYRVSEYDLNLYSIEEFADYTYPPVVGSGFENGYYLPAFDDTESTYMLVYVDVENNMMRGSALLPSEPTAISSDNNVVVVTLGNGSVWWSNDYGRTFYESDDDGSGAAIAVSVYSYNNILVGFEGNICRSTDGGRTFIDADPYHAASAGVIAIHHHNDKIAYALLADSTILMSDDGGETFIKLSVSPVTYPRDMIILDGMIIVAGALAETLSDEPVIYGSSDGSTWQKLFQLHDNINTYTFTFKLTSCGCGVVAAAIAYNDNIHHLQRSTIYRNVNWGASGCWEPIWEDYRDSSNTNGLMSVTDIECTGVNDIMAVGRILGGNDPLYFGIRFTSQELHYGKKWW